MALEAVPCFLERRVCKPAWTPSGVERAVACSAGWAHEGCGAGRGAAWRARARCQSVAETIGATWEPTVHVRERRTCARKRRGRCAAGPWTGVSDSAFSSMTNTFHAHVMQLVGEPHRAERIAHHVVLTSQCPACVTAFRRRSIPVAHLCRTLQASKCTADRSVHELAAELVSPVCCICHALVGRAETVTRFVEYNRHIVQYDLPIGTQERQVRLCSGMPAPEASGSGAVPGGLPRRKGARERVGRLGSMEERWSKAEMGGRKRAREVAARSRGANEGRSSTVQ